MKDNIISSNDNPNVENLDLAVAYTEGYLKDMRLQVDNLRSRSATFLGFGGLLLRFSAELTHTELIFLVTKVGAIVTSFCSVCLLGLALSSAPREGVINFKDYMYEHFLPSPIEEVKMMIINNNLAGHEYLTTVSNYLKNLLNPAIISLVFSALFFTFNLVLVIFEKYLPS